MSEFFVLLLAVTTAIYVGYPLFRSSTPAKPSKKKSKREKFLELEAKRARLQTALSDLEFERSMGKISEADYLQLQQSYQKESDQLAMGMEQIGDKGKLEDGLEEEILKFRRGRKR